MLHIDKNGYVARQEMPTLIVLTIIILDFSDITEFYHYQRHIC